MRILNTTIMVAAALILFLFLLRLSDVLITHEKQAAVQIEIAGSRIAGTTGITTLYANSTAIPHLYDWRFDGVDDYIEFYGTGAFDFGMVLGVAVWFVPDQLAYMKVVGKGMRGLGAYAWDIVVTNSLGNIGGGIRTNDGTNYYNYYVQTSSTVQVGQSVLAVLNYNGSQLRLDSLGEQVTTSASYDIINDYNPPIRVGRSENPNAVYFKGTVKAVVIYNASLIQYMNTFDDKLIPYIDGALIFSDPTFFNGTHYLNLFNTSLYPGIPYGGVQRVAAEETWIWVIRDTQSDGLVHVLVPEGWTLYLRDVNDPSRSYELRNPDTSPWKEFTVEPGTYEWVVSNAPKVADTVSANVQAMALWLPPMLIAAVAAYYIYSRRR